MSQAQPVELHVGANVYTLEGEKVGRLRFLIVDPEAASYSHLVLEKGGSLEHDTMIPIARVKEVLHRGIYLNARRPELNEMEEFPESLYAGRSHDGGDRGRDRSNSSSGSSHGNSGGRRNKRYRRHRD